MRLACILIWLVATTTPGIPQEKASIGDFTKSPTEHIINRVERPFLVGSVRGTVTEQGGYQDPLPAALVEIQGPDADPRIRRGTTDQHGRFKIGHVPPGTYKFKVTKDGFQSVMGTIVVSERAPKTARINIEMRLGV